MSIFINFTSKQLHETPTQNVSQSNRRKAGPIALIGPGPIALIGPGPIVILLIGPIIENASLILRRAGGMLQGI